MNPISYTVSAVRPESHLLDIAIDIRGVDGPAIELVMPAWTPGSYRIRDYARNVQDFEAGGLGWAKVDKNRWRVRVVGRNRVRVRYRVYAFELNARAAHLDAEHLYLNGAAAFMYVDGRKDRPVSLELRRPRGWRVATALRPAGRGRFEAADYDELVDSPIEVGQFREESFRVRGVDHRFVTHGPANRPLDRIVRDVARLVEAEARLFGGLPYDAYTFLLHTSTGEYGGLEHRSSCSLFFRPHGFRRKDDYEEFLELVAHEFFHLWNVKRLRPAALGPFDYEREVHTTVLWALEGLTSYYDGLFLVRAGLTTPRRYLDRLALRWQAYLDKPGRRHQSLSESSFDAWIKYYQPNEHSPNATISYYEKGEFVGLCLDLEIRRRTRNRRSLDDVLRRLYRDVQRTGAGLPESGWREAAEEAAGASLEGFWRDYVDGARDPDLGGYLAVAGLELRRERRKGDGEFRAARTGWIGAVFQKRGDGLVVATVRSGSPAERGGLCARDEVLALDGARVDAETWEKRFGELRPGGAVTLDVMRSGFLRRLRIVCGVRDDRKLTIAPRPRADALQKSIYRSWLGRPWSPAAAKEQVTPI